jgi:hypothetical protein
LPDAIKKLPLTNQLELILGSTTKTTEDNQALVKSLQDQELMVRQKLTDLKLTVPASPTISSMVDVIVKQNKDLKDKNNTLTKQVNKFQFSSSATASTFLSSSSSSSSTSNVPAFSFTPISKLLVSEIQKIEQLTSGQSTTNSVSDLTTGIQTLSTLGLTSIQKQQKVIKSTADALRTQINRINDKSDSEATTLEEQTNQLNIYSEKVKSILDQYQESDRAADIQILNQLGLSITSNTALDTRVNTLVTELRNIHPYLKTLPVDLRKSAKATSSGSVFSQLFSSPSVPTPSQELIDVSRFVIDQYQTEHIELEKTKTSLISALKENTELGDQVKDLTSKIKQSNLSESDKELVWKQEKAQLKADKSKLETKAQDDQSKNAKLKELLKEAQTRIQQIPQIEQGFIDQKNQEIVVLNKKHKIQIDTIEQNYKLSTDALNQSITGLQSEVANLQKDISTKDSTIQTLEGEKIQWGTDKSEYEKVIDNLKKEKTANVKQLSIALKKTENFDILDKALQGWLDTPRQISNPSTGKVDTYYIMADYNELLGDNETFVNTTVEKRIELYPKILSQLPQLFKNVVETYETLYPYASTSEQNNLTMLNKLNFINSKTKQLVQYVNTSQDNNEKANAFDKLNEALKRLLMDTTLENEESYKTKTSDKIYDLDIKNRINYYTAIIDYAALVFNQINAAFKDVVATTVNKNDYSTIISKFNYIRELIKYPSQVLNTWTDDIFNANDPTGLLASNWEKELKQKGVSANPLSALQPVLKLYNTLFNKTKQSLSAIEGSLKIPEDKKYKFISSDAASSFDNLNNTLMNQVTLLCLQYQNLLPVENELKQTKQENQQLNAKIQKYLDGDYTLFNSIYDHHGGKVNASFFKYLLDKDGKETKNFDKSANYIGEMSNAFRDVSIPDQKIILGLLRLSKTNELPSKKDGYFEVIQEGKVFINDSNGQPTIKQSALDYLRQRVNKTN